MNVGPCLSPISIAVQSFHKPKKRVKSTSGTHSGLVNPILSKRAVYSPPMHRRNKRKRKRSVFEEVDEEELDSYDAYDSPPPAKRQKLESVDKELSPLTIGTNVRVRFSEYITITACISAVERFGVLVTVLQEHPCLPEVHLFSKHWAKWRGETEQGKPVLHTIHQAME